LDALDQIPLPEGRRKHTKTKPMEYAELADCLEWWNAREENQHAWKISAADVLKYDADGKIVSANLDIKNPHSLEALEHRDPNDLIADILSKETQVTDILRRIQTELGGSA
jgi:type I restriction enzyme M protein